ncbi:sugar nucleotide-binding protein [Candidatus Pacearchaeota archaeon]|nr:sugar nucleotide-binding protein [Candidatus Pacearchaeota archaeon]
MKNFIFGAGYLGHRFSEALAFTLVPRAEVDLTDLPQLEEFLDREKPEVVINCAGKTSGPGEIGIDWCEIHREETIASNIVAPVNLSLACAERGIYFIHIGSGCVYSGDNNGEGYTEEDKPNFDGPQFYAKTKIDSERILRNLPGLLLRIRMPIDDRPHPRNLIDKLKAFQKVIDIQNSMTTVPDLVRALPTLIRQRAQGIYNVVNPGTISAAKIMAFYREYVEPPHTFEILSVEDLDRMTKGKRSNCVLSPAKLEREQGIRFPEIHDAVKTCLVSYRLC